MDRHINIPLYILVLIKNSLLEPPCFEDYWVQQDEGKRSWRRSVRNILSIISTVGKFIVVCN